MEEEEKEEEGEREKKRESKRKREKLKDSFTKVYGQNIEYFCNTIFTLIELWNNII